ARRFIRENREIFHVSNEELRLLRAKRGGGRWFVVFDRYYKGVRVWDARVDLRFTQDGRLFLIGADTYPNTDVETRPGLTVEGAVRSLVRAAGCERAARELKASELVVYPARNDSVVRFLLGWHVEVWTENPIAHYNGVVDAQTGKILLLYDDIRYDTIIGDVSGLVHPEHRGDPYEETPFRYEWLEALGDGGGWGIADSVGHFEIHVEGPGKRLVRAELQGDFVRVTNASGPGALYQERLTPGVNGEIRWDDSNSLASERDGYHHTNIAHDHIKRIDPGFAYLDYRMPCEMNIPGLKNAYWDGYGMHFGAGGNDFGQHADVIYHEYGHGITEYQYRPRRPSGGMHEGFSDFFAATITDDSRIGEGVMAYRDLDNNMKSPQDLSGESHHDGMIIGGALWHMRENLNNIPLAESLFHFARYGFPGSPAQPEPQNFLDYLLEIYVVDDDDADLTNGTPHAEEVAQAFGRHGIGPTIELDSVEATDIAGAPDMFLDPGDTVRIVNWVSILQPLGISADSAAAIISCTDPSIEIIKENSIFNEIPFGSRGDNSSDPFFFVVSDTLTRVIDVPFSVQLFTNPIFHSASFSFVLRVGHPEVLLVDDDGGAPYEMFFESSLDSLGIKPYHWDVKILYAPEVGILSKFTAIIWFTGDSYSGTLTDSDISNLSQYLDGGGRLFLTGQNIGEEIGSHPFYSGYLRASFVAPRSSDHILEGAPGDLIGHGLTVVTGGSGGGSNQNSQDIIEALPEADTVFLYDDGVAGVRYDSGIFKTVYLSFGLEGVNDFARGYDHRPIILRRILEWFGMVVGSDEECRTHPKQGTLTKLLQNNPNPFRSTTTINAVLPGSGVTGTGHLGIYDAAGRIVRSFDVTDKGPGKVRFVWDGRDDWGRAVPSGVYFCRLEAGDFATAVKILKVK
ncbi:MAG: FlgD immunoglobulin-like domain containing protein, partial [bacterium]